MTDETKAAPVSVSACSKKVSGHFKPDDLVFEQVQDNRITALYENNAQAWAAPLSTPAYLDMQHKLASAEASKKRIAFWALRLASNPRAFVSSCTTYVRDAIVTVGQGTKSTYAIVITDIFTHPEHRMRGLAKMLLTKLQKHLDEHCPDVDFTVLFGGPYVGMYRELGWKPQAATQLRILLENYKATDPHQYPFYPREAFYLEYRDVFRYVSSDVNISKLRLSGQRDRKTHVQVLPSDPLAKWHLFRSKLLSQYLSRGMTHSESHGAVSQQERPAWAWWVHDYKRRQLCIGRMFVARRQDFVVVMAQLLELAVAEAAKLGLREVVIWNPDSQLHLAADDLIARHDFSMHFVVEERLEMIPCLRWKGGEEREVVLEEGQFYASS